MISNKQLLKQLISDLWGKDSQRGYSFTYSWMANQLGHISLGFIPSCAVMWISGAIGWQTTALVACLSVAIFWTVFEFFNCLGSILKTSSKGAFKTPTAMVVFDTTTDVLFFCTGAFFTLVGFSGLVWAKIVAILLFITVLFLGAYWLRRKMYAWQAGFAIQFRLAQFVGNLSENDTAQVNQFMNDWKGKHLLISGVAQSGKTLLATGIATELAFKKNEVLYKTLFKWMPEITLADSALRNDANPLWSWREATIVVIDDVAPSIPTVPLINPSVVTQLLTDNFPLENKTALTQNGFIWVIGNPSLLPQWDSFLQNMGVESKNICNIAIGS